MTLGGIGLLVLGWLLGMLSPAITKAIGAKHEANKVRIAIDSELREFAYALIQVIHISDSRRGSHSAESIEWLLEREKRYRGHFPQENMSKALQRLKGINEEPMAVFNVEMKTAESNKGLALKSASLPYLQSKIQDLPMLTEEEHARLLEIWGQVSIYNETIGEAKRYYWLTFDSSVSSDNYATIRASLEDAYYQVAFRAKFIVQRLDSLNLGKRT